MEKEEILKKSKKCVVGEMEKQKINSGNWLAIIITGVMAVAFMIVEGALGHFSTIFVVATICHTWACALFTCQFFMAKRPWPVLIGSILHGAATITFLTVYILSQVQGWW